MNSTDILKALKSISEQKINPIILKIFKALKNKSPADLQKDINLHFRAFFKDKYSFVIENGWLLDPDWSSDVTYQLELLANDKTDFDAFLTKFYTAEKTQKIFDRINYIIDRNDTKWNFLLSESIEAFNKDLFHLTIPALFSILEGVLTVNENFYRSKDYGLDISTKICKTHSDRQILSNHILFAILWALMQEYISKIFSFGKFNGPRNKIINRNWVLHGRDSCCEWKKIDSISLFNTISILLVLKYGNEDYFDNC